MTNLSRHRIIEHRGSDADAWFRHLDRMDGDLEAFVRYVAIEHGHFYRPAPQARGPVMIPRAAVTYEFTIHGRRLALTMCREPKFILLDEVRD